MCCVRYLSEKTSAIVRVIFSSERTSEAIQKALEPETTASITNRSRMRLSREGKIITLVFEAKDTTALRASMNSYLNWLRLLQDVCGSLET